MPKSPIYYSLLKLPGLQYIKFWKHLSNYKVFEAHSVPVHAWWRFVVVDARQKKLDVVVGPKTKASLNVPASSSCKHPRIVLS